MEEQNETKKNRGGRPKKAIKRDQLVAIKCTLYERTIIGSKAKKANLTVSEYLREIAIAGKIDCRNKALPKEILSFAGVLNHMAANLNQIAKKRNRNDELSPLERAELKVQSGQVKDLAVQIKNFMS